MSYYLTLTSPYFAAAIRTRAVSLSVHSVVACMCVGMHFLFCDDKFAGRFLYDKNLSNAHASCFLAVFFSKMRIPNV